MSDIIAAVYKRIEEGEKEGLIFLDRVQYVSGETLAPALLEFLLEQKHRKSPIAYKDGNYRSGRKSGRIQ